MLDRGYKWHRVQGYRNMKWKTICKIKWKLGFCRKAMCSLNSGASVSLRGERLGEP